MSFPIFTTILSLLPTHAQGSDTAMLSNTKYLYDYKPLAPLEPAEPEPAAWYYFENNGYRRCYDFF